MNGIHPANKLPIIWPRPCVIIVNKENLNRRGTHQLAFFVDRQSHGIYFDSLSCKPKDARFAHALLRNLVIFEYNDRTLQDYGSNMCGYYCIFALHYFAGGGRLSSFQRLFTDDYKWNDQYIMTLYKEITKRAGVKRDKYCHLLSGSGLSTQQLYCKI